MDVKFSCSYAEPSDTKNDVSTIIELSLNRFLSISS